MKRVWISVFTNVALICFLLATTSLVTPGWVYYNLYPIARGLWEMCDNGHCKPLSSELVSGELKAVQTFHFLTCAALLWGFIYGVILLVRKGNPGLFVLAFSISGACSLLSMTIYTALTGYEISVSYGYSYAFGWAVFGISFICACIAEYLMTYNK